jgi:hypothetical protein
MFDELDDLVEDRSVSSKPDLLVLFYPCVDETTPEEVSYGGDAIGTHGRDVSPLYHVSKGLPRFGLTLCARLAGTFIVLAPPGWARTSAQTY